MKPVKAIYITWDGPEKNCIEPLLKAEILALVIRKPLLTTSSTLKKIPSYLSKYTATKADIHPTTTDTVIKAICLLLSFPPFFGGVE